MTNRIQELLELASQNDAEAQYELADSYFSGNGIPPSPAEAFRWYRAAAEQGFAEAQNNLGAMYLNGIGTEKNPAEAIQWYKKAAEQSELHAQFNLAMLYLQGIGVEQDIAQGIYWLHAAAEQGDLEALFQLGNLYLEGQSIDQDIVTAAELLTEAAIEGHQEATSKLAEFQEALEEAALEGSIIAALCLSKKQDHGIGQDPNTAAAYAWLQWARLHGKHDEDEEALEEWESYIMAITPEEDVERGKRLLNEMRGRADEMA